ncbi:MAG TPA: hypothetical protein VHT24_14995 [Pseudacidobacterium sp.]|jgi:uncharacterized membrane protein|nr:hypothetical protein [Pseudacidobacterium sp.]
MDSDKHLRWLPRFGEFLLALLMVYSGVMHFRFAKFVALIVPPWIPWRLFWAYFTGIALLASGISIAARRQTRLAATLLGVMLGLFVMLIHLPSMALSITQKPGDVHVLWSFNGTGGANNALKDTALTLSAFLLAASSAKGQGNSRQSQAILGAGFAAIMVLFGIEHFFYTRYTPGIPSWSFVSFWIPWRLFWGYFTGAFLLVSGVMILIGKRARSAATALGAMILIVAVLTYAFRVAAGVANNGEFINTLKDVAVAGGAFILAGVLPKTSEDASVPQTAPTSTAQESA